MNEIDTALEVAWRDGVGPDDAPSLTHLVAITGDVDSAPLVVPPSDRIQLVSFAALSGLSIGVARDVPAPTHPDVGADVRVLASSAALWSALTSRDLLRVEVALSEMSRALVSLPDAHPRAASARALADLVLAESAILAQDHPPAQRRLEQVAHPANPIALRIAAELRLVTLLVSRTDIEAARQRARHAAHLADAAHRPLHAQQATLVCAILDYAAGHGDSVRHMLGRAMTRGSAGLLARVLLADFEPPERALPLFADGLREAVDQGDAFAYATCILYGARRYRKLGHDADALLTLTAGLVQLEGKVPEIARLLIDERDRWRAGWSAERRDAIEHEAAALTEQDRDA